jgi:uncharacterized protein (DUF305 family)
LRFFPLLAEFYLSGKQTDRELATESGRAKISKSGILESDRLLCDTLSRAALACPDSAEIPADFDGVLRISPSEVLPVAFTVKALKVFGRAAVLCGMLLAANAATGFSSPARARQADTAAPVVVQPGAPGKPSRTLPPSTKATLPPRSQADVEFMQGMIMHHSQAVEMTALIASRTENEDVRSLGARISRSQSDEIKFMQRWLAARGEPVSMATPGMPDMDASGKPDMDMSRHPMTLMPGMLTSEQMEALRKAKGAAFDRLFLTGMIQHHNGALIMVKDLFDTAGAGQDAAVFDFATDVDSGQRAEIRIMQTMLEKKPLEEKR